MGGGKSLLNDRQMSTYYSILNFMPNYTKSTTLLELINAMPNYSSLFLSTDGFMSDDYKDEGRTIRNDEIMSVTGWGYETLEIIKLHNARTHINLYNHQGAMAFYGTYHTNTGFKWTTVGKESWHNITLQDSFTLYTDSLYNKAPRYRIENDRVYLSGSLKRTTSHSAGQWLTIGILPVQYRPKYNMIFYSYITYNGVSINNVNTVRLDITQEGKVFIIPSVSGTIGYLSLAGISFELD